MAAVDRSLGKLLNNFFHKKIKRQNFSENKIKFTTNWELEFYRDATKGFFEFL